MSTSPHPFTPDQIRILNEINKSLEIIESSQKEVARTQAQIDKLKLETVPWEKVKTENLDKIENELSRLRTLRHRLMVSFGHPEADDFTFNSQPREEVARE